MTRTSVFSDKNVPLPSAKVRSGGGGNGGSWCYSSKFVDGGAPNGGHCTAAQRKRANSSKDLYSPTLHVKAPSVVGIFSLVADTVKVTTQPIPMKQVLTC